MIKLDMTIPEFKKQLLVGNAKSWLSIEEATNNGNTVEALQRTHQKTKSDRWPLHMSFVQTLLEQTDSMAKDILGGDTKKTDLPYTEDIIKIWKDSRINRTKYPKEGDIIVWQHYKHGRPLQSGLLSVIVEKEDRITATCVEARAYSDSDEFKTPEPGIFLTKRNLGGTQRMKVLGYLSPWQ